MKSCHLQPPTPHTSTSAHPLYHFTTLPLYFPTFLSQPQASREHLCRMVPFLILTSSQPHLDVVSTLASCTSDQRMFRRPSPICICTSTVIYAEYLPYQAYLAAPCRLPRISLHLPSISHLHVYSSSYGFTYRRYV